MGLDADVSLSVDGVLIGGGDNESFLFRGVLFLSGELPGNYPSRRANDELRPLQEPVIFVVRASQEPQITTLFYCCQGLIT